HDVVAAGGFQARDAPGVLDDEITARHEKDAAVAAPTAPTAYALLGRRAAEVGPTAVVATAREFPAAAEPEAAVCSHRGAGRHQPGADEDRVVLAPKVLCRAIVKQAHQPRVQPDHAVDPRGRHAPFAERQLNLEIGRWVHLVATPATRLEHPEQPGGMQVCD